MIPKSNEVHFNTILRKYIYDMGKKFCLEHQTNMKRLVNIAMVAYMKHIYRIEAIEADENTVNQKKSDLARAQAIQSGLEREKIIQEQVRMRRAHNKPSREYLLRKYPGMGRKILNHKLSNWYKEG